MFTILLSVYFAIFSQPLTAYIDSTQKEQVITKDQAVRHDEDLTRAVRVAISSDASISAAASTVEVTSENGTVTLTGFVSTQRMKRDIEAKVKNLSGVKRVINKIQLK